MTGMSEPCFRLGQTSGDVLLSEIFQHYVDTRGSGHVPGHREELFIITPYTPVILKTRKGAFDHPSAINGYEFRDAEI